MSTPTIAQHGEASPAPYVRRTDLPTDVRVSQARVLRSEWVKFFSLRSSYYSLAAAVVGMIGIGALVTGVTASHWMQLDPRERAHFDPTSSSLNGYFLAQLVIAVLGALVVTGEYGTGMIRASMSAAPRRLPVVWAKAAVFAAVTFVVSTATAFVSFFVGQALLSSQHIETTLGAPGVLRAVIGVGLYLTVVGLLGGALGWIIRSTAGSIAAVFGLLLILPVIGEALPSSWGTHINPYLPSNAGQEVAIVHTQPGLLAPWTGFAVFCLYAVAGFAIAVVLLKRRDV